MKLLIDVTFLFDQYAARGIGRFGKEVVSRILTNQDFDVALIGFKSLTENLHELDVDVRYEDRLEFFSLGAPHPSGVRNILRWYTSYRKIISQVNPDTYFAVHFERGLPTTPLLKLGQNFKGKTVVVCHDVIPLAIPDFRFSHKGAVQNLFKKIFYNVMWSGVRNSKIIITDSLFSKNDIVKFGHAKADKIFVAYLGVDPSFYRRSLDVVDREVQKEVLAKYGLNEKSYFLYDSGLEANKGINELIAIFARLPKSSTSIPPYLVITGKDFKSGVGRAIQPTSTLGNKVLMQLSEAKVLDYILTPGVVSDSDLKVIFANASIYINLSKYEGFGLGPIQAMAAEVPTITSNLSCFPEVTDGGALLIDITNVESAVTDLENFLDNNTAIQTQVRRGREVVRKYNWDNTAKEVANLLR